MLKELLVEELRDMYHAEGQLVKALPKMAKAASAAELKQAFEKHLQETQQHVERLKQAFELLGEKAKAKPCKAMEGLLAEGKETITEGKEFDGATADLALISAAQRVEHYEMAAYSSVRAMAEQLGQREVANLLANTLAEEEKTSQTLTKVAVPLLKASSAGGEEEEEEA